MDLLWLWIFLSVLGAIVLLTLLLSYICYRLVFFSATRKPLPPDTIQIPSGKVYEPFYDSMKKWALQVQAMPHEDVSITSFDGLTLRGTYYEYAPGAPIELMFHGYRGNSARDMTGGVLRCFKLGRSALIVDQRASGYSDGHVISFGINEHRDCLSWLDFMVQHFGANVKIILTGVSMGAATVLTAADKPLPPNVIGILADCGYTSAKEIIYKVMRQIHVSPSLLYPFIRLGARLFGHFSLEETSPIQAMKKCTVPVIFFHGESDDYVPCEMSRKNYEACTARKMLVTIPDAGHCLCYPIAPDVYLKALEDFFRCKS